jgi:xanthine dehydrogenase YagS FAD-binding subunit
VSAYLQARERRAWAFALVGVAARLAFRDGRIAEAGMALCGVAPVPWRLSEVEDFLTHSRPNDPGWIQEAGRIAIREARPLSGNAYKVGLVQGLVERALRRLSGQ